MENRKSLKGLTVSEQFYSIQGEGRTMGFPAYFLRLTACNLMCGGIGTQKDGLLHNGATWRCDSIESWIKGVPKTFEQIVEDFGPDFIKNLDFGVHLIITGGEPLIQQQAIIDFINFLDSTHDTHPTIEIETNGTIMPIDSLRFMVDYWNVSPKLRNSGEVVTRRFKADVLSFFNNQSGSIFKYVIGEASDLMEVMGDIGNLRLDADKVWLMPAGSTQQQLAITAPMVAEYCKKYRFNYSHRIHVAIWDQALGV